MIDKMNWSTHFKLLVENSMFVEAWNFLEEKSYNNEISILFEMTYKGILAMLIEDYVNSKEYFNQALLSDLEFEYEELHYNYLFLLEYTGDKMNYEVHLAKLGMKQPLLFQSIIKELSLTKFMAFNNVVIGTMAIGNQSALLKKWLEKYGFNATTVDYYPNYLKNEADFVYNLSNQKDLRTANIECKNVASQFISKGDLFHFNFATTLTLDYSDLEVIKVLNKPIIMQFWGSDVRLKSIAEKHNPYIKVKDSDEVKIIERMKFLSKYTDVCVVDYELREYVQDYFETLFLTRTLYDFELMVRKPKTFNMIKTRIIHAPTARDVKGTQYIVKAVNELKFKYDIDFILVEGKPHAEAMNIYRTADIVIDQLHAGLYGMLAVECMAMGIPVITWISEKNRMFLGDELPIISANPDTIKQVIEHLIINKEILSVLSYEGIKYSEKHHDAKDITAQMINMYYQTWRKKNDN